MTSPATTLPQLLLQKSKVSTYVASVQSVTSTGFTIVINGQGTLSAYAGSDYLPAVGESVRVWFVDGVAFLMGPSNPKPAQGTVVSAAAGLVTLSTTLGNVICPYASTLTPTGGQVMQIVWGNGPFAVAVLSTSVASATAPSGSGGGAITHVDSFTALAAGSYQSRWWTSQVYDSSTNEGLWFYGSKIADTLPAPAVIARVQLYASPAQLQGASPIFGLHPYQSQPAGAPAAVTSGTTVAVGGTGWVDLPVTFGNALKAGGGQFGIGTNHGGYNIFKSLAQDGQSGALQITSTY